MFREIAKPAILGALFALNTGCTDHLLEWAPTAQDSISGSVTPLLISASQKGEASAAGVILSCTTAQASLYRLDSTGSKIEPSLTTVPVNADGSYQFTGLKSLNVQVVSYNRLADSYLTEITACNATYSRVLTSTEHQDVNWGTSLISSVAASSQASAVVSVDRSVISDLYDSLASAQSFDDAYSALANNTALSAKFLQAFGAAPSVLRDASPSILSLSVPSTMHEGETSSLLISTSQWSSSYNAGYLWELDGHTLSTNDHFSYVSNANTQGAHVISVFWGQRDANGNLDQTKPYQSRSFNVAVANDLPATAPALTAVSTNINSTTVNLRIATGTSLANCASFSALAITEDLPVAPSLRSQYAITCSQAPTQNISYTLQGSVGAHTLYLWAMDATGGISAVASSVTVHYSLVTPVVAITSPSTNGLSVQSTVTLSGTCDADSGDVTFTGDLSSSSATACNSGAYSKALTLSAGDGSKTITASQTNQSQNTGSASVSVIRDTVAPTVSLAASAANPTNAQPIAVTVTFSESVTGFNASKLVIANGSVTGFSGSGASYSFNLVPSGQGPVTVDIPAGSAADPAGNANIQASTFSRTYDTVQSAVTISSTSSNPTNASPIPVNVSFAESVTGFALGGITVTNGTASNLTGSGASYSFSVTPSGQGAVTVQIAAGAAQDVATNASLASNTISRTFDNVAPTLTLSSSSTNPTNLSSIPMTATFSEAVTGLTLSSINVANGSASNLAGSGTTYTFTVAPSTQGNVSVQVTAGAAHDAAGNVSVASNALTRTYDSAPSTVTIASATTSPTNVSSIPVTVVFSKSVTGFALSGVSVTNGTATGLTGSGANYSFNITPSSNGTVSVSINSSAATDAAGNGNQTSNSLSWTYDATPATATLASTAGDPTKSSPIPVTVTFSKSVSGFSLAGLNLTNASASGLSGSGATYSFNLTPSGEGSIGVSVKAGAANDAAGNGNSASSTLARAYDSVAPTVTVATTATSPTNTSPIPFTATFSEAVTGLTTSGISVTNGSASMLSGSGNSYSFNVIPSGNGAVSVSIGTGAANDAAGNGNSASSTTSITFNNTHPSVTLAASTNTVTNSSSIPVTITFSASVSGLSASSLTLTNATITGFSGSGASYSFNVVPTAQGALSVALPANSAQDGAANGNLASNTLNFTYDTTAPTVTLASIAANPTNLSSIPVTVIFSEAVTGFSSSGLNTTNATISGFTGSGSSYSFNLIPSGQGTVSVDVAAGIGTDAAGNANAASTTLSRTYDSVVPTFTLSSAQTSPTNISSIPVSIVFSKSVTGLTLASFAASNGSVSALSGSGASYSLTLTPSSQGTVSLSLPAGAVQDAAGNSNAAGSALSLVYDTVLPTATLSSTASTPTNAASLPMTATFSKSVTGLTLAGLTVTNGTASSLVGSGTTYTFSVAPSGQGAVAVSIAANKALDAASNGNSASNTVSIVYDSLAPTLAVTSPADGSYVNLSNQSSLSVAGTCSENGQNVALAIGAVSQSALCSSGAFSATFDLHALADGALTLSANLTDSAGNAATPMTVALAKDTTVPTAVLAGAPSSPSRSTSLNVTVGGTGVVSYKFKVGGASVTDCTSSSGYSASTATGTALSSDISSLADGSVKICAVARNAAGNDQTYASATSVQWTKDTTVNPFSGLAINPSSPGNSTTPTISGTTEGSAIVQIYSLASCLGSVLGNGTAAANGSFSVTPGSSIGADGNYAFSVQSTDLAGNVLCSSTSIAYTLDTSAPTVTLASVTSSSTNVSPFTLSILFSKPVTGLALGGFSTTNATLSALTGSGSSYSLTVTPSAQGTLTIGLTAGAVRDAANNGNPASSSFTRVYDSVAPTLTITSPAAGASFNTATVAFSGACETGLTIVLSGTGVSSPASTTCTSSAYSVAVTPTAGDGTKNVTLAQTDAAGNTTTITRAIVIDTVVPTLTFTSAAVQTQITNGNTATFTGNCENGLSVVVSGADTSSASCSSGAWSYTTASQSTDANRTYTFRQTDAAGNSTAVTGSWTRDTAFPALTLTSPAAGTSAQTGVTLVGACESGLNIAFTGTGLLSNLNLTCSGGTYSQFVYFSATDGAKSITISQTDAAGNTTPITRSFTLDTTAPAITQTTRSSPFYSNGNTTTFGGACENGISIVVSGADSSSATCSSSTWTYTTASQSTDAARTYTFTQTDSAGNAGSVSATWNRLTAAPAFAFTSSNSFLTSGNSVTFTGSCVSGFTIAVTGSGTSSMTCSAGAWSYTASQSTDATYNYTFTETDQAGNTSSLSGSWTRSTAGPVITITQSTPQNTTGSTLTISGTCSGGTAGSSGVINISGAVTGTTTCSSTTSTVGTWSYSASKASDGAYTYTFTTTDNFSTPRSSSASLVWNRDTTAPAPTASSFSINGGQSTTAVPYNNVSFSATDNLSTVTSFCLKTTNSAPNASDSCWYPLNGSAVNVTPSNSISVSNYSFSLGIIPQAYSVYLWLMDGVGNISTNTGTSGKDVVSITLSPVAAPSVSTVLASYTDTMNNAAAERVISAGSDIYIRWTASGSSLSSTPVTISFSSDDSTWTTVATGLANGVNNCASLNGSGTASSSSTGCYKWASGSPSSNYFRIRVSVTNTLSATTFANSAPVNAASLQVLAGNTETGLNGSATSGIFQSAYSVNTWVDAQSLVVNSHGTVYFRDTNLGLVTVDPQNGLLKQLIPLGATTAGYGDGGSIANAKLRWPTLLAIDGQDRVLIFDYDRIRRIDFSTSPATISTIIGGGSTTTDTVAAGTSLKISNPLSFFTANANRPILLTSPSGDVYFFSESTGQTTAKRLRVYSGSTGAISSIYFTGAASAYPSATSYAFSDFSKCGVSTPLIEFSTSSSSIQNFYAVMVSGTANTGCTSPTVPANSISAVVKFNPATGAVDTSQTPAAYYLGGTGYNYANYFGVIPAMDGKIYVVDRNKSAIQRFDSSTGTWTTLVGTGTVSACADGTAATSCAIDAGGAFVDAQSHLYFVDRGRIRTIQNGNVVTVYGQSFSFGDGGLATNARFGLNVAVAERSDSKFIVHDAGVGRMRMFSRSGNIQTIAGNDAIGASSSTSTAATSLSLNSNVGANNTFVLDSSDNLYFNESGTSPAVRRLPASAASAPSTTTWSLVTDSSSRAIFSGSTYAYYSSSASGQSAGIISAPSVNAYRIMGGNGTSIFFYLEQYSGGRTNEVFAEMNLSTAVYTINMGPGAGGTGYCANGTALSSCTLSAVPAGNIPASYDSVNSLWLFPDFDYKTIRSIGTGMTGTIESTTTLASTMSSFVFKRFPSYSSHAYYYYCNSTNGRMYLRDATAATEVALNWPVTSIKCTGSQIVYDAATDSVVFSMQQNGLYGVAEVLNAHPSANGM